MFDEDERIDFQYSEADFTEGKLNFHLLPEFKPEYDEEGFLINKDEAKPYYEAKEKNKLLREFTQYQHREKLWQNYDRLTPNQQKALQLLVTGNSVRDTARECKINEATLYRWLQLDIFIDVFRLWREKLLIEADSKINRVINKALEKLEFILDNPSKFDSRDYLKAIEISLNFVNKLEK